MYSKGDLIQQDYKKASFWFLKAAKQGDASAQRHIAEMYGGGIGVAQNNIEAYAWAIIAASGGDKMILNLIENQLKEIFAPLKAKAEARAKEIAEDIKPFKRRM